MAPLEYTSDKQAYYTFIDPGRMKGCADKEELIKLRNLSVSGS